MKNVKHRQQNAAYKMNAVHFVSCILLLFHSSFILAQAETHQQRIERLRRNIELAIKLEQTQTNARENETQLRLLNSRIASRQALIDEMSSESDQLSYHIDSLTVQIERQQKRLAGLKNDYARMLQYVHTQQRGGNKWLFILSASNFSQRYRRFRYIQDLTENATLEMEQIEKITARLEARKQEVSAARTAQDKLIQQQEEETRRLAAEKNTQASALNISKQQEAELMKALDRRENYTKQLGIKIRNNTATEARGGLTEQEEKELTMNFARNKGRLPAPVERGIIVSSFGKQ
ncbi:MAG: hypothetical protein LBR75_06345, partial [Prevotellaceae bacterium]|nr:hypothetical protein [Prevotellaceae bacterium]